MESTPESPQNNPRELAAKGAAEAMLGASKKIRKDERVRGDEKTVLESKSAQRDDVLSDSPFGKPYVAPVEVTPGQKPISGKIPVELMQVDQDDIEDAFGNLSAGDMEQKPVEKSAESDRETRKRAAEHDAYAKRLKLKQQLEELRLTTEEEDESIRRNYRERLGLEVNKPIPKGKRFAFTPYEVNKLREMEQAAKRQQPPSEAA